jgi:regulator of sirC expression with transglutaminase-like and TPR domain
MAGAGGDPSNRRGDEAATPAGARRRFVALSQRPDDEIDLAEGALLIAAEEYPGLDVGAGLSEIDALAARVRRYVDSPPERDGAQDPDEAALAAMARVLFVEEGFSGADDSDYYTPRNSYLNDVLERKRGLPILLSVLYCAVARRAGLDAAGIGLPGRFIVQFRGRHTSAYIDPFDGGARLTREDCVAMVGRVLGQTIDLTPNQFLPTPPKQVLARILTNLKLEYLRRGRLRKALAAVDRFLVVSPSLDQVRDRGVILLRLGEHGQAWFDLSLYARLAEGASDAGAVRDAADRVWRHTGRHN